MTTQYASASYQEIIDLHTETDRVSVLGIHTPTSQTPYEMLSGFFDSFQKYHYDGCSFTLVPAARLPADPSQVSYEAGEQPIDPRDLLNPILWHGCHGESLGAVLNQFYAPSDTTSDVERHFSASMDVSEPSTSQVGNSAIFESLYYRALTDNTWQKAHPQRGFRKSGLHPLVYNVTTNRQFVPMTGGNSGYYFRDDSTVPRDPDDNNGLTSAEFGGVLGTTSSSPTVSMAGSQGIQNTTTDGDGQIGVNTPRNGLDNQMFATRLTGLGWLDTRVRTQTAQGIANYPLTGDEAGDSALLEAHYQQIEGIQKTNYLPRLFMGICLLPPAYKTEQYFRVVINHRFSFKKFRGMSMGGGSIEYGQVPNYYNLN